MKKLTSILLALTMLLSCVTALPMHTFAEENKIEYDETSHILTVTDGDNTFSFEIVKNGRVISVLSVEDSSTLASGKDLIDDFNSMLELYTISNEDKIELCNYLEMTEEQLTCNHNEFHNEIFEGSKTDKGYIGVRCNKCGLLAVNKEFDAPSLTYDSETHKVTVSAPNADYETETAVYNCVKDGDVVKFEFESGSTEIGYYSFPESATLEEVLNETEWFYDDFNSSAEDMQELWDYTGVTLDQAKCKHNFEDEKTETVSGKTYVTRRCSKCNLAVVNETEGKKEDDDKTPSDDDKTPSDDSKTPSGKDGASSNTDAKTSENSKTNSKASANTASKNTIKLTLKKAKIKKSAKKITLKATLLVNGKTVKGEKVTFKVAGIKFTAKTNKKGVAKLVIKGKKLKKLRKKLKVGKKIKVKATFNGKTVTKKFKVKK